MESRYKTAIIKSCSEHGCSMDLGGIPRPLVIKGELTRETSGRQGRACDCLVVTDHKVAFVELKNYMNWEKAQSQLQASARRADELLESVLVERTPDAVFILVSKHKARFLYSIMRNSTITFQKKQHYMKLAVCGSRLALVWK